MPAPFSPESLAAATTVYRAERRVARFQDVDAATTVYFPRFFEYASDLYISHLTAFGIPMRTVLEARTLAIPLRHVEADYRYPLFFEDPFVVELVAMEVGTTSFSLGFRMRSEDGQRIHALVQTVHVCIDPKTVRPVPVPDEVRRAFTPPTA